MKVGFWKGLFVKLDTITVGPNERPVVRLYQFDFQEVANLANGLHALASGGCEKMEVQTLPRVEAVDGTRLLLRTGTKDEGLVGLSGGVVFECVLTPEGWDTVEGLVEPFRIATKGFQWLVVSDDAKLLLSVDGQW